MSLKIANRPITSQEETEQVKYAPSKLKKYERIIYT